MLLCCRPQERKLSEFAKHAGFIMKVQALYRGWAVRELESEEEAIRVRDNQLAQLRARQQARIRVCLFACRCALLTHMAHISMIHGDRLKRKHKNEQRKLRRSTQKSVDNNAGLN